MKRDRTVLFLAIATSVPWVLVGVQDAGAVTRIPTALAAAASFGALLAWGTTQLVRIAATARASRAALTVETERRSPNR